MGGLSGSHLARARPALEGEPAAPRSHLLPKSSPGPRCLAAPPADNQARGVGLPSLLSLATKDNGQWASEVTSSSGHPRATSS